MGMILVNIKYIDVPDFMKLYLPSIYISSS